MGVHRSTSLTSSSLLLQQCLACLARQTCIVFVMGGRWPYNWRLVGWEGKGSTGKLKFDHITKCYMHKPESVLENETQKILLDFEIKTDHLIPARRPDPVITKKKKNKKGKKREPAEQWTSPSRRTTE